MEKIILFYRFVPLEDTEVVKLWQRNLAERLNLKGRIIISKDGINGTLGGNIDDLKTYVKLTRSYTKFKGMIFKWSDGARDDFPKLSVKIRNELVSFGVPEQIDVNEDGVVGGGKRISPNKLHELVAEKVLEQKQQDNTDQ